ncbi:PREDICTED: monocarboxylate transporter 4-like [Atta cephalotes]|uniref:Major facilitator superfamily (MFS) profile domain-containing protein n=1 Tax=Atta cephalotes TaxID=12957 RepID=A0A158NQL8_ATTCE|nr:PREDICTED: monocarboxylate transporter 4-like [Atta cephalotes]XP_018059749.1 PREDICTED: monocarboxylate transporter 4-like [Atta colombica]
MLVDDCGSGMGWTTASVRGGWSTPGGCRNSAMSFGGSVPSLHPTGSIRSLRSQHSMQAPPETPRRCIHCHPVHVPNTPNNYMQHPMQYYTPTHCMEGQNGTYTPHRGSSYHGDTRLRYMDDETIGGNTNWVLGDLRSLHRCVPALRRTGIDVAGMRAHFYPEGGWGWLVCAAGFLALLLTTGMQLAFGLLHLYAARHLGEIHLMDIVWAGALSAAISRGSAPLVVGACRRGNTRLTAVIGGLVLALASLFTSFAVQMHQVLLSYGLVLGTGAGLVRETASLVLGNYFRKRREFVEMVVQAGTGVGIVLFSVVYKEAVGKLGWRPGLQSVTGALSLAFFLGLIYRSASLYHPQRRAILHLKNQRSKVKEKKSSTKIPRQPLVDLSPLGSRPVRMLMLAAGAAGFGLYTPAFYIALQGYQDGLEASALVLLQTFLGLAAALGCAALGVVIVRPSAQCLVSRQYLCQAALIGVAVAQVALGSVQGYHGLVLASALYGASLGGTLYSLKMLALERLRARHFARSWALVQAAEALPILLGVPLTGYMNASSPRVGYYACTLSSLCGAALLFLVGWGRQPASPVLPGPRLSSLGIVPPLPPCACPPPPRPRLPKSQSLHVPLDVEDGMREREFVERVHHDHHHPIVDHYCHPQFHTPLRPSKSVPEGLGHQDPYRTRPRRHRDITVIEQITTSV